MASTTTLTLIRELLATLNGEDSVDSTTNTSRDRFINSIIRDVFTRSKFPFRRASSTLTFTVGVATLPTDFASDGFEDLREVVSGNGDDHVYNLIDEKYKDNFTSGDYVCWITNGTINIHEATTNLTLVYYKEHTDLVNGTDTIEIPALCIAKGAYSLLRKYDDPEYNNKQEIAEYEAEINKLIASYDRGGMKTHRAISPSEQYGNHIGQVR